MIDKLKMFAFNIVLKKYVLGWAVKGYDKAKGWKTYICIAAWIGVFISEKMGWLDPTLSDQVQRALEAAGGFSLLDKLSRVNPYIDKGLQEVRDAERGK